MIQIFILISLFFNTVQASTDEDCPPEQNDLLNSLTAIRVPNCRLQENITRETRRSVIVESRRANNLSVPNVPSPICETCRNEFNTFSSSPIEVKEEKKDAFFETSYRELEKSLTSILTDVVSLRKTWSTGSQYSKSAAACNVSAIAPTLAQCDPSIASKFNSKNLISRMANEVAALLNTTQTPIEGILARSAEARSCNISDEAIAAFRPGLFEEYITPSLVQAISSIRAESASELQSQLEAVTSTDITRIIRIHPILRPLMQNPTLFIQTFQSFAGERDLGSLKSKMREKLFSKTVGDSIDEQNASKCNAAIQGFTRALCSEKFKNGNISLGPFSNYNKFLNNIQLSNSESSTSEDDLKQNTLMFNFCDSSTAGNESLEIALSSMNNWMLDADKNSSLATFASEKYSREFGDIKLGLCNLIQNPPVPCPPEDEQCKLLRVYQNSQNAGVPEGRIAQSADSNINNVLRSFVGNPSNISPRTREVLIAEGILPQANGSFVEREQPAERDSSYLSGVANGSITPNVGPSSAARPNVRNQNQQQASQGQQSIFQPLAQSQAAASNNLIQPDVDDDSDASRNIFNDLEARRRDLNGQQPTVQNGNQPGRRTAARQEPQNRRADSLSSSQIAQLPQMNDSTPAAMAPILPSSGAPGASLDRDTTSQTRAERERNAALAQMAGARANPFASGDAGRSPASAAEGQAPVDQTIALTLTGDIRSSLERVLNGSDSSGEGLRSKIMNQSPFLFQLNNSVFDVQFTNGSCVVTSRSNNPELARTLQGLFNNSLRSNASRSAAGRTETLENLRQNLPK